MEYIKRTDPQSGEKIRLSYKDYGEGTPIVLIHGWPLSKEMWEYQLEDLVTAGFRVIKYDRRGFGKSSKPWDGYNYDTFTDDLHAVLEELDLKNAVLVGFSMGGGEAVRYLSKYGSERVSKIVLISAVTPFLGKTDNNPDGVPQEVFQKMMEQMKQDRINFLDDFGKKFFGVNLVNHPVSSPLLSYYLHLCSVASPRATTQTAMAFAGTDFRQDLKAVNVPTLIIHGSADKTVPIEASGDRTAEMLPGSQYLVYDGAPHGLFYTHREQLNQDIINFVKSVQEPAQHVSPSVAQNL